MWFCFMHKLLLFGRQNHMFSRWITIGMKFKGWFQSMFLCMIFLLGCLIFTLNEKYWSQLLPKYILKYFGIYHVKHVNVFSEKANRVTYSGHCDWQDINSPFGCEHLIPRRKMWHPDTTFLTRKNTKFWALVLQNQSPVHYRTFPPKMPWKTFPTKSLHYSHASGRR